MKVPTHKDVATLAYKIVHKIMEDGVVSHGKDVWFKNESMTRQTLLASRHLLTYQLQALGEKPSDGDDHLANALVRCAMALAKRDECGTRFE
jgi:hypothetical protein